jgi:hypothetical protein
MEPRSRRFGRKVSKKELRNVRGGFASAVRCLVRKTHTTNSEVCHTRESGIQANWAQTNLDPRARGNDAGENRIHFTYSADERTLMDTSWVN